MIDDLRTKVKSLAKFRASVIAFSGTVQDSSKPLTMLYIGYGTNLEFLSHAAFDENPVVQKMGRCNIWRAGVAVEEYSEGTDMVVVDIPWPYDISMPRDDRIVEVPAWIRQEIQLADSFDNTIASLRKSVRDSQLRKIRKFKLTHATTHDAADIDHFYDAMYVPHVQRRFGLHADIESRRVVHRCVAAGALLNILRDDEVIGACVLLPKDDTLRMLLIGFPKENLRQVDGASAALYFYTLKYAHEKGFRSVDYCGSRPFLNDGVLDVKRRWGAGLFDDWSMQHVLIQINEWSPGAQSFLGSCPIISCEGDKLIGRVLASEDELTEAYVKKTVHRFVSPGIDGLNIYSTREPSNTAIQVADSASLPVRLIALTSSDDPAAVYCRENRDAR